MQIKSGHLTITVDHTKTTGMVKSEQAYINMPVNDMNPSRIC
jgi:hypothetical protein